MSDANQEIRTHVYKLPTMPWTVERHPDRFVITDALGGWVADFATDIDSLLTTYLTRVARLIPEHGTPTSDSDTRTKTKVIGSPAPWNDIAAGWYYDVHAGARRHETHLRTELAFTTLLEMHGPGA